MNTDGGQQNFSVSLATEQLRRDAQNAMNQFTRMSNHAIRQGQRIDTQFNQVGTTLSSTFKKGVDGAKSAIADLTKNIVGISALMASGSFIKDIYSSVGEFNKQMKIVSTISDEVTENMEAYKQKVLGMCTQLAVAPETAAAALYQINSAGHLGANVMQVLEVSAKAAIGGVTETAVAADAITTILNAYKMSADEAESVSDKLFTTVRLGKTTMDELGRSIAYVAPLAATYKISIDEVLAAVAQLTKQGNSTQNSMTQISASIIAVANEMGDDAFKDGLLPALEEIEKRSNGSNLALKAQLSNIRAVRGALGLTKENAAETAQMIDEIKNSAGAADAACRKMNTSSGAELTKLKNNFIKEFSELATDGMGLMGGLAKALNDAFDTGRMQDFLSILGLIVAAYGANKAILLSMSAIERASQTSLLEAEYAAYMQLLPAKEADVNADIQAAVASGALTEAKGTELIALREELAAKIASAQAAQKLAADELAAAKAASAAAAQKLAAAETEVEMWNRNMLTAQRYCMAEEERQAMQKLGIAVDAQQTAAIEANTAAKRLATAQAQMSAASTEVETLTHQQNTVTQAAETASTGVLAVAKKTLMTATAKLNAVMMANPYTIVAAAVFALGIAIYKLATYQTEAAKAQKRLNESISNCNGAWAAERVQIDILFNRLRAAKKGTEEYARAKNDITKQYGNYLSGLRSEISSLQDVEAAYNAVASAANKAARARAMETYVKTEGDEYAKNYTKRYDKIYNIIKRKKGESFAEAYRDEINDVISGKLNWTQEFLSQFDEVRTISMGQFAPTQSYNYNPLKDLTLAAQKGEQDYAKSIEDAQRRYGLVKDKLKQPSATSPQGEMDKVQPVQDKAYWEKQRDDAQAALDAMSDAQLKSAEALALIKKRDEAKDILNNKAWGSSSKNSGSKGDTPAERTAALEAAQREQMELLAEQARERARAAKDAEFAAVQASIDAMEDGAEKMRKQKELDFDKELQQLQQQKEDEILAEIARQKAVFDAQEEVNEKEAAKAGNKHYAKRTFNSGGLTMTHDASGAAKYTTGTTLIESTIGNVDTTGINDIIARYDNQLSTLTANRVQKWIKAETDAMNEYLAQWGQGMEKRNAIIAVANRRMEQAETEGERKSIFAQMQKDLSDFDIEANKTTNTISLLFADMTEKTIADLKKIYTQGNKALSFLTEGKWDAQTGMELGITEETFNVWSKSPEQLEKIRKALRQLKQEIDGTESGFKKLADGLKDVFKAGGDTNKFEKALGKISEGMQTVMQVGGFLKDSLSQLGEAFGSDTLGDVAEGVGVAMDAMDSAMQGAQAGAAFGPWGAAAGAAIGLVSSLGSAIGKLHDAKHEKKIQELQNQVEVLERNYEALGRAVEKAYSKDAKNLIEQQNTLLLQQKQLIQNQIAEEKSKKKSDEDRIKDWEQQIRDIDKTIADNKEKAIDAIFGEDVQAAIDRFAEAYESMFDGGTSRARASKDLVKDMIKNMITEAMKADISEPMEKLRQMMLGFWSDEKITDWEKNRLEDYVDNMLADQEKKWGWADGYFKDSTSQSSSKGGFTTMSQDSADELNGRFTALQQVGEQIKVTTIDINEQLKAVATRSIQMASAVDEIRGLQLIAVDHLETIRMHTANLEEMKEKLENIEKYTSRI